MRGRQEVPRHAGLPRSALVALSMGRMVVIVDPIDEPVGDGTTDRQGLRRQFRSTMTSIGRFRSSGMNGPCLPPVLGGSAHRPSLRPAFLEGERRRCGSPGVRWPDRGAAWRSTISFPEQGVR
jgi:hypothetical protein